MSIIINLILSLVKFAIGVYINSIALIVDGFHTLSDLFTSVVVIFGFKSSEKPPDREHPFGHGRYEDIATFLIAILLAIVGFEFLISSTRRFINPEVVEGNFLFFSLVILTVFVKEALARYSIYLSRKIDSSSLLADAWHHRSDALAAIPVAFGILASSYGYYRVDPLCGIFVSFTIIYVGYKIAKESATSLMGRPPSEEFIKKIRELATLEGVLDVHDICVHDYKTRKAISLNVTVEPMGLEEAHTVADSIEKRIHEALDASVVVHVDGARTDDAIKEEIGRIVKGHKKVVSCHAIDVGEKIDFHILVNKDMSLEEAHSLAHHLKKDVFSKFKKDVLIHTEPCIETCELCRQNCEKRA